MQIQISLDTFDDSTYEVLRGVPGGFTKVRDHILALKEAGFSRIAVGSVLTKDNLEELVRLQQFCLENGLTYRVTAFQFEGFGSSQRHLRSPYRDAQFLSRLDETVEQLKKFPTNNTHRYLDLMGQYYRQDKFHPFNCAVGYYKVFILPNGDVSLCNIMHKDAIIGTVKEGALKGTWTGQRARDIRRRIKQKRCPSCWLSCFAEDNLRFTPFEMLKNAGYFFKKALRYLVKLRRD